MGTIACLFSQSQSFYQKIAAIKGTRGTSISFNLKNISLFFFVYHWRLFRFGPEWKIKWNIKSFSSFCGFIGWDWRYQLDISGCYILLFDRKRNWCLQGHPLAVNLLYCDIIMQPIWGGCLFPWSNNTFIFIDGSVNCVMGRFNTQGIKSRHHGMLSADGLQSLVTYWLPTLHTLNISILYFILNCQWRWELIF